MRTVKWNPFLSGVVMLLGGVLLWAGAASADISSTNPAAIVVFPKIVVDTTGYISENVTGKVRKVDTVIQLTNTNTDPNSPPVNVRCFYVNANGHCSNDQTVICDPGQPAIDFCPSGDYCVAGWVENDFYITLTVGQPVVWTVSQGLTNADFPLISNSGIGGQLNGISSIPPSSEDPMIGELKCVEVGTDWMPVDSNDLKGEATIEILPSPSGSGIDIEGYNAIGIQALKQCSGGTTLCNVDADCQPDEGTCSVTVNNADDTLCLGTDPTPTSSCPTGAEYNGCPNYLILDHFFDDALDGAALPDGDPLGSKVETLLTLVPCSEDFLLQTCVTTTVQYLVYNEFEQRFSTSRPLTCFSELQLSDIDTRLGDDPSNNYASIFNVAVEGTLTGQTLIHGVDNSSVHPAGNGLLGVVHEFHRLEGTVYSAAYMLALRGARAQGDIVQLPVPTQQ
jgi:hypothetical protein